MGAPRLILAAQGDLREHMDREKRAVSRASKEVPVEAGRRYKAAARGEVRRGLGRTARGGRGARVANAIRDQLFSDSDFDHAVLVYSKFGRREEGVFVDFLAPFTTGATLKPRRSRWLFIPLERGVKARRRRRISVALNKNVKFIPARDGRKVYLVRQTKRRTTLLAVLVRRVTLPRRLDFEKERVVIERDMPRMMIESLEKPI